MSLAPEVVNSRWEGNRFYLQCHSIKWESEYMRKTKNVAVTAYRDFHHCHVVKEIL